MGKIFIMITPIDECFERVVFSGINLTDLGFDDKFSYFHFM